MSAAHLSCSCCRIRLFAGSPAIEFFERRCPICGVPLVETASAADVIGFRYLDPATIFGPQPDHPPDSSVEPPRSISRRNSRSALDVDDAGRWCDDGGSAVAEAVASRPALR